MSGLLPSPYVRKKYFSRKAIAAICGVHPQTVVEWERDRKIPRPARAGGSGRGVSSLWSEDQLNEIRHWLKTRFCMHDGFVGISDIAKMCAVHEMTVRNWMKAGKICAPARPGWRGKPHMWTREQADGILEWHKLNKS